VQISAQMANRLSLPHEVETICLPSGLKFALETSAVCPTKVCRQLPAKSQSLRLLSHEAETICLPWDLVGNCLQTFVGHTAEVLSANFSPDGKQIVSASVNNNLKLCQPYAQQKFVDNYLLNPKV
jgi:WD40 repeat protein